MSMKPVRKIKLLNNISPLGLKVLEDEQTMIAKDMPDPDAILLRSADMHEYVFNAQLKAIARAGAGVNNIPLPRCTENGIVVFNTPGGNANSVKELTICALLLSSRDVLGGIAWVKEMADDPGLSKAVEAGKGAFAGVELHNRNLGVIGLGAVGGQVANVAQYMGMNVIGCDPFLSVDAAWRLSRNISRAATFEETYTQSDYLSLHVPSTPDTKGMINQKALSMMRPGVRIINMARADLVDAQALKKALDSGHVARYVTDFPTPELNGYPHVISIPHLGASTEEAEDNCAVMAARQLKDFLQTGNIVNSVNFPTVTMPHSGEARICIMHNNIPSMLARFSTLLAEQQINIENMLNRSRDDIAYTMIEINGQLPPSLLDSLSRMFGVIRVNSY